MAHQTVAWVSRPVWRPIAPVRRFKPRAGYAPLALVGSLSRLLLSGALYDKRAMDRPIPLGPIQGLVGEAGPGAMSAMRTATPVTQPTMSTSNG